MESAAVFADAVPMIRGPEELTSWEQCVSEIAGRHVFSVVSALPPAALPGSHTMTLCGREIDPGLYDWVLDILFPMDLQQLKEMKRLATNSRESTTDAKLQKCFLLDDSHRIRDLRIAYIIKKSIVEQQDGSIQLIRRSTLSS